MSAIRWSLLYIAKEIADEKDVFIKEELFNCIFKIKEITEKKKIPYTFGEMTFIEVFNEFVEQGFLLPVNPDTKYQIAFNISYYMNDNKRELEQILGSYYNKIYKNNLFKIINEIANKC
ncbi:MAG: hypothetical protein HZR80_03215 [Candidatus Heimdallarchaeota archaeon]